MRKPLTEQEKMIIEQKCSNVPVKDIAKEIKRGNKTVYDYIEENSLQVFRLQSSRRSSCRQFGVDKDERFVVVGRLNLITGY